MKHAIGRHLRSFAWALTAVVLGAAFVAWGQGFAWRWSTLNGYRIFPLLGLTAFSTMWAQYVTSALQQYIRPPGARLGAYFRVTGFMVLGAIILHPGILVFQLWRNGFGLPPESYLQHFVAPGLRWVALLGTTSLFIFLAYELRRWYGKRPWWRYMDYAVDAAIIAIYYHALRLGAQTQSGWFQKVWFFYGITLAAALTYIYVRRFSRKQRTKNE